MSFDGSTWTNTNLGLLIHPSLTFTSSSPNGIAFDSNTGLLYLATFGGNRNSSLFNYNVTSGLVRLSGQLGGQCGSGAFFGGYFWYVEQRSDVVHRVAIDQGTQVVISDTIFGNIAGGSKWFDFGDIEFGTDGRMFFSAKMMTSSAANAGTVSREYSTFDLNTRAYVTLSNQSANSELNQIALGSNGLMYNTNNGALRSLALNGGFSSVLTSTATLTDLGSSSCLGLDLNGDRIGWSTTAPYVSGSPPIMLVSYASFVGLPLTQSVTSFTATLRLALNAGFETLSGSGSNGISLSYNPTTRVLTATGTAPVSSYMVVLNSLSYFNSADPATPGTRFVDVTATLANGMLLSMNVPVVVTLV